MKNLVLTALLAPALLLAGAANAQIQSLSLASTNDIDALNWTAGQWYVRAIQRDASDRPLGSLTAEISFLLDGQEYPAIEVTMYATAPEGHDLLFLRSNFPISMGDTVDGFVFTCSAGSLPCSADSPSNIVLGENLSWTSTVVPGIFEDGFESGGTGRWSSASPSL